MSLIYLPLAAYAIALNASVSVEDHCDGEAHCKGSVWVEFVSGLLILFQTVFVLGLQAIGRQLSDPYGNDPIDMSVQHFLSFTLKSSRKMLEAHRAAGKLNEGETPGGEMGLFWRRPVAEDRKTWAAADGPMEVPPGWESVTISLDVRKHENDELRDCQFASVLETFTKGGESRKQWVPIEVSGELHGIAGSPAELEEEMRENARLAMHADAEEVAATPVVRMGSGGLGQAFEQWRHWATPKVQ
jgi:hypothetical protein